MAITIEVNTYYKNLFFVTIVIVAIISIELIANNEKYTLITNSFAYLVILEIDYS